MSDTNLILVGLDGCLSETTTDGSIGQPVPAMLARVKRWLGEGRSVHVLTHRVYRATELTHFSSREDIEACDRAQIEVQEWCEKHVGALLPVTCTFNPNASEIWHTAAVGVLINRGVTREDLISFHMSRVMTAAGMKLVHGMEYGTAADQAAKKIRTVMQSAKDAHAYLDGARDALDYALKPETPMEFRENYLRQARTALVKALEPLMRALADEISTQQQGETK